MSAITSDRPPTPTSLSPVTTPPDSTPSTTDVPLPTKILALKDALRRRRSSFPPLSIPGYKETYDWEATGLQESDTPSRQPSGVVIAEQRQAEMADWSLGQYTSSWDSVLPSDPNFQASHQQPQSLEAFFDVPAHSQYNSFDPSLPASSSSSQTAKTVTRSRAESVPASFSSTNPSSSSFNYVHLQASASDSGSGSGSSSSSTGQYVGSPHYQHTNAVNAAQLGTDLAWKTILSSQVTVEGVGNVVVARILHEIWKRGGGDAVTNQCLWPQIIMALSYYLAGDIQARIPTPSAQASLALQGLYNLTLRHWEPSVFSGLLAAFAATSTPSIVAPPVAHNANPGVYGTSTPTRDVDIGQWMNITPGIDWSAILSNASAATGATAEANTATQAYAAVFDPREDVVGEQRRSSLRTDDGVKGIDEILASIEDGAELAEMELARATVKDVLPTPAASTPRSSTFVSVPEEPHSEVNAGSARLKIHHLPTPETDCSDSPATIADGPRRRSSSSQAPISTKSAPTAAPTTSTKPSAETSHNPPPPGSLAVRRQSSHTVRTVDIPSFSFVPPPPMCMFFKPTFKDITTGKLGVWKGDLEVRGRGGGKFSILVVGETGTDHLWQSHKWGNTVSYPPATAPTPESYTSTMIPVSHLARDGFTPLAMGMVLCNDPDVQPFCDMVQGLHAEGVAFQLPNSERLPLVFLPAKFNNDDTLQRLGLAYMSKPGLPTNASRPEIRTHASAAVHNGIASAKANPGSLHSSTGVVPGGDPASADANAVEAFKKRKRRQSAPAADTFGESASPSSTRPVFMATATAGGRKKRSSYGLGKVEEESVV